MFGLGKLGKMGAAGAVVQTFDPVLPQLFAHYDPTDMSSLYQSSAGITPVTALLDPVGMMQDKSGLANHVTQSGADIRPLYLGDRLGFIYATNTTTRIATIRGTTATTIPRENCSGGISFDVLSCTQAPIIDLGTSDLSILIGKNSSSGGDSHTVRFFNGTTFTDTTLPFTGRKCVVTWRSNGTALTINVNGTDAVLAAQTAVSMTRINLGMFNGGVPQGLRLRKCYIYNEDIGATNIAGLQAYLRTDIGTDDSTRTVVIMGDSMSAGVGSEIAKPWWAYLTDRPNSRLYSVAQSGGYAFQPPMTAAQAVALKGSVEGIYHLWMGTNDINSGAKTGLQTAATLKAWSDTVRASGGKVIVYTLQAFPSNDAQRLACNAQIATDSASYDAIVDLAAAFPDETDTTYYTSDQVHFKDAGFAAMAALADAAQAAI